MAVSKKKTSKVKSTKASTSKTTTSKKTTIEHFKIPLVEIKPIEAINVTYCFPYKQFAHQNQTNHQQNVNVNPKQLNDLTNKVNELTEKNKQWQSKYDSLHREFDNYKKQVEQTDLNQPKTEEKTEKKAGFWNKKKNEDLPEANHQQAQPVNDESWLSIKQGLEDQIKNLTVQLELERTKMVDKVQEKATEAKKILDEKIAKLEQDKQLEVASNKFKVFESIINSFLDPYIIFRNTLESINNPQLNNYLQGFRMIADMIKDNLINLGVQQICVNEGDEFDESYMVAFDVVHSDQFKHNQVVKIVNPGYVFSFNNEQKVLKFASVVVAK